ncbi:hypothetical protein [uncultured Bartonella sp.]|uniref:hypothetical protein n=1 Tax=uncultured Bartonella sp. TaxID=104108 RepID=UPI0025EF8AC6|nr:hypothetical protein [uncultured Bartonella sp.]
MIHRTLKSTSLAGNCLADSIKSCANKCICLDAVTVQSRKHPPKLPDFCKNGHHPAFLNRLADYKVIIGGTF